MAMNERRMTVSMRVRFAGGIALRVRVLVVRVMAMGVLVLQGFVHMLVLVALGEMEI